MKKILLAVMIVLCFAGSAWGTTYYVIHDTDTYYYKASPDWPTVGDSDGTSTSLTDLLADLDNGGHELVLSGGAVGSSVSYTDLHDTANTGVVTDLGTFTLRGCKNTDDEYSSHGGTVIIDGSSIEDDTMHLEDNNVTIENLRVVGPAAAGGTDYAVLMANASGMILNDLDIVGHQEGALYTYAVTTTINRCIIRDANYSTSVYGIRISDKGGFTDTVIFNSCLFENNYINLITGAGTITFNNCDFINNEHSGFRETNANASTITINNSIFVGNATLSSYAYVIDNDGSSNITLNNCDVMTNGIGNDGRRYQNTDNITENSVLNADPKFVTCDAPFLVSIGLDDHQNLDDFETLASNAEDRNFTAILFLDTYRDNTAVSSVDWTTMDGLVDSGHEIACHTRHHPDLADRDAFTIEYTGAAAAATITITIDYGARTGSLITTTTGAVDDVSYDFTISSYDTVGEISAALTATGVYTVTENYDSNRSDSAIPICLTAVVGQDVKSPATYDVVFNETNYFNEEITLAKSDIETGISGYTCKSFGFPYGTNDETARDAVKNAGFIGARSGDSGDVNLKSIDIYYMKGIDASIFGETDMVSNLRSLLVTGVLKGRSVNIFGHSFTSGDNITTEAEWNTIMDTINGYSNVYKMNTSDQFEHINETQTGILSDGTLTDGETWTRTITTDTDLSLRSDSPCRDTGTDVGLTSDILGNAVPWGAGFDIGAYEYHQILGPMQMGLGLTL